MLTLVLALLAAWAAAGQTCRVVVAPEVPKGAADVLRQRFSQMLEAGGFTVLPARDEATGNTQDAATGDAQAKATGNTQDAATGSARDEATGDARDEGNTQVEGNTQAEATDAAGEAEDVPTLWVQAVRTDRMEMPGSRKQVAVVLEVTARQEDVTGTFTVKGVGDDDADAWLRAVKQILPRSKAAQAFVKQLL